VLELCFFAEKRSLDPQDVTFQKWQSICSAFGVDYCYIIDRVKLPKWSARGLRTPHSIIHDFSELKADYYTVFVEKDAPSNKEPLPFYSYSHPDDALYCFGGDACGMSYARHGDETDLRGDWIYIPSQSSLWSEQAAAIILADRWNRANT